MTTEQIRRDFEACVRELFNPGDHSMNLTVDRQYYNSVGTKSYGGRVNPEYAPVQMLWEVWRAAIASQALQKIAEFGEEQCKPVAVPGWKLVPVEPTHEMQDAGCPVGEVVDHFDILTAWSKMIKASPTPPLPQVAEAGKPLTDVQSFTFMRSVLQWNRALPEPLIKVAYEYHVASEIEKLYEAAHGIGPEQEGGE
jgi:hypothetical protein